MAHVALLVEELKQRLLSGEFSGNTGHERLMLEIEKLYKLAYKQGYNDRKLEEEHEDE